MPRHSFRDIILFVATYEERSFTAAAAREHATQSGVSQHIRKLELQFDVSLFERSGGQVTPTPAGDIYYNHCVKLLRASDIAGKALADYSGSIEGTISVGLMPTITRSCLAGPLAKIKAQNLNAQITVVEGYSADLTAGVRSGALDFAIVPKVDAETGLVSHSFVETPEVLVGGSAVEFDNKADASARLLDGASLILPTSRNQRRNKIDAWLLDNGAQPARILEMDSMMGTLDLIQQSEWVSVLPALLVAREYSEPDHARLQIAQLGPSLSDTPLVCIERSRSSMSELGMAFLELLKSRCDDVLRSVGVKDKPEPKP